MFHWLTIGIAMFIGTALGIGPLVAAFFVVSYVLKEAYKTIKKQQGDTNETM